MGAGRASSSNSASFASQLLHPMNVSAIAAASLRRDFTFGTFSVKDLAEAELNQIGALIRLKR